MQRIVNFSGILISPELSHQDTKAQKKNKNFVFLTYPAVGQYGYGNRPARQSENSTLGNPER